MDWRPWPPAALQGRLFQQQPEPLCKLCNHEQRKHQHQRQRRQHPGSSTKQRDCCFNHNLSFNQELVWDTLIQKQAPQKLHQSQLVLMPELHWCFLRTPWHHSGFGRGGLSSASPVRQKGWPWRLHTVGGREGNYTLESKIIWQVLSKVTSALCGLCGAIQSCLKYLMLTF